MPETNKSPIESSDGYQEELHEIGIEINSLVPEEGFSVAAISAIDSTGTEHTLINTKPSNPGGFVYVVEQRFSPTESKSWTWDRAVQEDRFEQVVKVEDGELVSERLGFEDADLVEIKKSVTIIKSKNGEA